VEKLSEFGYPQEKIGFVEKCILNHRGSQKRGRETLEEQIVAEADVLANFDEIAGIFKAAFVYEGLTQGQARESVLQKLTNKFEQLHFEKSKEIISLENRMSLHVRVFFIYSSEVKKHLK